MAEENVQLTPATESPVFDTKAFIEQRNRAAAGQPPAAPAVAKPATPAATPAAAPASAAAAAIDDEEDDEHGTPGQPAPKAGSTRAARREANRLREELGYERGRREALEELVKQGLSTKQATAQLDREEVEPKRDQFANDADYNRAIAKWEAKKVFEDGQARTRAEAAEAADHAAFSNEIATANAKFVEDIKAFPDWAEAHETMKGIPLDGVKHQAFVALIGKSDVRAAVLYHFGKNPDKLMDLLAKPISDQIRDFHRLEGRLANGVQSQSATTPATAAQAGATPKGEKTAPLPEKPAQGAQTAADRDIRKPRPSSEVAAHGGSTPPEEPAPGTKAWMDRRNQAQFGR